MFWTCGQVYLLRGLKSYKKASEEAGAHQVVPKEQIFPKDNPSHLPVQCSRLHNKNSNPVHLNLQEKHCGWNASAYSPRVFSLKLSDVSPLWLLGAWSLLQSQRNFECLFSVTANWPVSQAAGLQQPPAAAVNTKRCRSALITSSLHLVFNIITRRLRNNSDYSAASWI